LINKQLLLYHVNKSEAFDKAAEMIKIVGLTGQEHKWAKYPNPLYPNIPKIDV
jgi:ABC-type dipeptide/oligopeptide/nickel transport system ATPase component